MKKQILSINLIKDWEKGKYNTFTPFKNNNNYGSELNNKITTVNLVKDWNSNIFNTTVFKNNSTSGYELKTNKSIDKQKIKNYGNHTMCLKNKNKFGYEMNEKIANTSISKPRYWPSRGLYEK